MTRRTLVSMASFALLWLGNAGHSQSPIFVATTDFQTGSTALWSAGLTKAEVNLLTIHSDASVRFNRGRIYVVNRLGQDNILVLDPANPRQPLNQFSVGNGTNPHDIVVVSDSKAYVSRYGSTELLIVNPANGAELGSVDLSSFSDADGLPEMSQMTLIGNRLYVACQRLDRDGGFVPADIGVVAVIDTQTDLLVDGIALSGQNPHSMRIAGDRLVISLTGAFGDRQGGIEVFMTDSRVGEMVISETQFGGDVQSIDLVTADRGYAVVADENFTNLVVPFDLARRSVGEPLQGLSGGFIPSVLVEGDRLIVADQGPFGQTDLAGLLVYDTNNHQRRVGPISTGLPPNSLALLGERRITAVLHERSLLPNGGGLGDAYPNPFNASTLIPVTLSRQQGGAELAVFDVVGRRVRTLMLDDRQAGAQRVLWDGRDEKDRAVATGTYLIRLVVEGVMTARQVTLLK
ncbi:MAG: FlgD immunoglobulin-like domain containing protein [Candidatus Latescibacterota bacterium]|nr:FlgD immunoglobulin-like domain containing protein [Candidatus Latescibacterota bacterium]